MKLDANRMHTFLTNIPQVKKEAFVLLVRTKTRADLKRMRTQAVKDDSEDVVRLLEAAMTLRTFIETGVLKDLP